MPSLDCRLSPEAFDQAVHGGLDDKPILPEGGDLAVYIKPNVTVGGKPMAVVTFTVQLPDGSLARAQATTTLTLLDGVFACIKGWREGGHL
jgi:hypothetical protein